MNRIPALFLVLYLVFSLAACSGQEDIGGPDDKILVAYFSCTNNTERVAEHIANILDADLYEIVPEEPYTNADLENTDSSSNTRIALEQSDDDARPAISSPVEDMDDYNIIFLGYPIWWGDAPKIMHTFLESYDFSGKTIIPFCTSGNVDIGSSATDLHSSASGSPHWLDGMRFQSGAARQTIVEWIDELPIKVNEE